MERVPLVRLLSMAVTVALDELHTELARRGHPNLRPVHGYALNAVHNGSDTASALAPILSMTKQGAAKVVKLLLDEGYLVEGPAAVGDARRKPLALTARGRAVIRLSERVQDGIEAEWARLAGERPVATTRRVLVKAVTGDGDRASPPPVRLGW
jgi:DNA-binding MarR family transcriptional regulator